MRGNPLLAYEQDLISQLDTSEPVHDEQSELLPPDVDETLYPRVRRVVLSHNLLKQAVEAYTGVPLPDDANFYALRNCYGDECVHLFVSSPEFLPTEQAIMLMQHVPVLEPRKR